MYVYIHFFIMKCMYTFTFLLIQLRPFINDVMHIGRFADPPPSPSVKFKFLFYPSYMGSQKREPPPLWMRGVTKQCSLERKWFSVKKILVQFGLTICFVNKTPRLSLGDQIDSWLLIEIFYLSTIFNQIFDLKSQKQIHLVVMIWDRICQLMSFWTIIIKKWLFS